jgi:hypothetical protein
VYQHQTVHHIVHYLNTPQLAKHHQIPKTAVLPQLHQQFEKNAVDAHLEGRSPVVALRYYWPDSPLANPKGWVDFAVRLLDEDAELREDQMLYHELLERTTV